MTMALPEAKRAAQVLRAAIPDLSAHAPGGPTLAVIDPFANVIRFCQAANR